MSKKTLALHNGSFHPDDIFTFTVFDLLYEDDLVLTRTRDQKIIEASDIVADVGGVYDADKDRFDHHQVGGAGVRSNGIPYASIGLVWKKYGEKVCGTKEVADIIEQKLIQSVDAYDNAMKIHAPVLDSAEPYLFDYALLSFNPSWKESSDTEDVQFKKAAAFAKIILQREIEKATDKVEAMTEVEKIYQASEDKRIIVLNEGYPFQEVLTQHPEPLYAICPDRANSTWRVIAVRSELHTFHNRKDLPASWAGKRADELPGVTGVPDAVFCHNKLFLAVAVSKEGALRLATIAVG